MSLAYYTEKFQSWTASSPGVWEQKDLSAYLPSSGDITAEILIANSNTVDATYPVGVRQLGTSTPRLVNLFKSENASAYNCVTMHSNVVSGKVESQLPTGCTAYLLGYWTGAQYVEKFYNPSISTNFNTWANLDLSAGVGSGAPIVEVICGRRESGRYIGVRSVGNTADRRIKIHQGGGLSNKYSFFQSFVKSSGTTSTIERYVQSYTSIRVPIIVTIGYWSTPPGDYIDSFDEHIYDTNNPSIWRKALVSGLSSGNVASFGCFNNDASNSVILGMRESGSVLSRNLTLCDAVASGNSVAANFHTNILSGAEFVSDTTDTIQYDFTLLGHWENLIGQIHPLNDNCALYTNGMNNSSGQLNLYMNGSLGTLVDTSADFYILGHRSTHTQNLYYSEDASKTLFRSDLQGGNSTGIITEASGAPRSISYDHTTEKIYATFSNLIDNTIIKSLNPDGSNTDLLYISGSVQAFGIALHVESGYIYFTNIAKGHVERMGIEMPSGETAYNRTDIENIVDFLSTPLEIKIDQVNDKLYYVDGISPNCKINRCDLDGSNLETVVTSDNPSQSIGGIALDILENKIYFGVYGIDPRIMVANIDGTNKEIVYSGFVDVGRQPLYLSIDYLRSQLYWGERIGHLVEKIDLDGSNHEIVITGSFTNNRIAQVLPEIKPTDMFIHGHQSSSVSGNLYLYGNEQISSSIDLIIDGIDISVDNIDLYVKGYTAENDQINLYIDGHESVLSNTNLYILGDDFASVSGGHLFVHGFDTGTSGLNLYIDGINRSLSSMELFTQAYDIINISIDLYIHAFSKLSGFVNLLTKGSDSKTNECSLFVYGIDSVANPGQNLYINGSIISNSQNDLYLYGKKLHSVSGDLYTHGISIESETIDAFITGPSGNINSCTLILSGFDVITSLVPNLYIHGVESKNDNINLFLLNSGQIISMSGNTSFLINGYVAKTLVSCPTLDATASIQIGDELIEIYQSRIDALINQIGKNVYLEFSPIIDPCPNCTYDTFRKRSTGIYIPGGPRPFERGRRCPYCKGEGFLETEVNKCIKALIKWGVSANQNFGLSLSERKGVVRLKTLLTDADDIARAKTAIVNHDIVDQMKLRVKLIRGPIPAGLREDRYALSFWKLV